MVNYMDIRNYKKCYRKHAEMWVCKPLKGTIVFNELTHQNMIGQLRMLLKGKKFIPPYQVANLERTNKVLIDLLRERCDIVSDEKPFVVCGTQREMYTISYQDLCSRFDMFYNNSWASIQSCINNRVEDGLMQWYQIRQKSAVSGSPDFALFVPVKEKFQIQTKSGVCAVNDVGVQHGKGDYIVVENVNGRPDANTIHVVNGYVFTDLYDNKGWQNSLSLNSVDTGEPEPLFSDDMNILRALKHELEPILFSKGFTAEINILENTRLNMLAYKKLVDVKFKVYAEILDSGVFGFKLSVNQKVIANKKLESVDKALQIIANSEDYNYHYSQNIDTVLRCVDMHWQASVQKEVLSAYNTMYHKNWKTDAYFMAAFRKIAEQFDVAKDEKACFDYDVCGVERWGESEMHTSYSLSPFYSDGTCIGNIDIIQFDCYAESITCFGCTLSGEEFEDSIDDITEDNVSEFIINMMFNEYKTPWNLVEAAFTGLNVNMSDIKAAYDTDAVKLWEFTIEWSDAVKKLCDKVGVPTVGVFSWADAVYWSITDEYSENKIQFSLGLDKWGGSDVHASIFVIIENGFLADIHVYRHEEDDDPYMETYSTGNKSQWLYSCINKALTMNVEDYAVEVEEVTETGKEGFTLVDDTYYLVTEDGTYACSSSEFSHEEFVHTVWANVHSKQQYYNKDVVEVMGYFNRIPKDIKVISAEEFSQRLSDFAVTKCKYIAYTAKDMNYYKALKICYTLVIDFVDARTGYVYCHSNMWGIADKFLYHVISKSTFKCLSSFLTIHENLKFGGTGKVQGVTYNRRHYHDMVILLGYWNLIPEFKYLKLQYLEYAESIWKNQYLPFDCALVCGNYAEGSDFESLKGASGYAQGHTWIVMNGNYGIVQQRRFNPQFKCTLVHEMCHFAVRGKYGTTTELPGEDGGTLFGISETYKDQWDCHGKRFDEEVTYASEHSEFRHDDIFNYGVGHGVLRSQPTESDRHVKTTAEKNAFDFGQGYRRIEAKVINNGYYCKTCGKFNCNCSSPDKIQLSKARYIGVCNKCGKVHYFTDATLTSEDNINLDYYSVVDRYGLLATKKCDCGGKLTPKVYSDNAETAQMLKTYMKDFIYAQRYVSHMYELMNGRLEKYASYFKRQMNCDIELSRGRMPFLSINLVCGTFSEMYKFFVACNTKGRLCGRLYRDYGIDYKGYLVHNFRLNTEKDVYATLEYIMMYIRKDARGI